ncbi:hypothetical protein BWQ96_00937 [Gracilariopsis chorda]|uniref:Uncharacterized protein n=1 Tax=Gracilariopsis chorda TaxID=448386 RepID=A0A2V3J4X0_9FLOR|nr:hypothetical protein BWQ96_00937 [Gracilariopsis chorda]|eukprot:PXF49363.1 hypothetical protein BWQ96_00937 [Gracilariopsis chorda]
MSSKDPVKDDSDSVLGRVIRSGHHLLDRTIAAAKRHSPLNEEKLKAADDAVAGVIHKGYQAVKKIAVNGNPAVILSAAGVLGAAPSLPFGVRTTIRNAGLGVAVAAVMIYPDHLRSYIRKRCSQPCASRKQVEQ